MKKLSLVLVSTLFLAQGAFAKTCDEMAIDKNGKPLHGAAKTASVKKCMKDNPEAAAPAAAAPAAVDGKTAQQNKMKKCNADAKGKKGDERKQFMSACLSN
jgi:hypothetical protein